MNINLIVILFVLHFLGDFLFQSRWMAENKGKNVLALSLHVLIYSLVLFIGLYSCRAVYREIIGSFRPNILSFADQINGNQLLWFVAINFLLHFVTDLTTSQFTRYFWEKNDKHKFFAVIGFDQCVHQICLMITAKIFLGA